jgi:hypothetical protein
MSTSQVVKATEVRVGDVIKMGGWVTVTAVAPNPRTEDYLLITVTDGEDTWTRDMAPFLNVARDTTPAVCSECGNDYAAQGNSDCTECLGCAR